MATYPNWPQDPDTTEDYPSDRREVTIFESGEIRVHTFYHVDAADIRIGHFMDTDELASLIAFISANLGTAIDLVYQKHGTTETVEAVGLPAYVNVAGGFQVTQDFKRVNP